MWLHAQQKQAHKILDLYWYLLCIAAGSGHNSLTRQWKKSQNHDDLVNEIKPILDDAIDQPEALTPQYATSLFTQVINLYAILAINMLGVYQLHLYSIYVLYVLKI